VDILTQIRAARAAQKTKVDELLDVVGRFSD